MTRQMDIKKSILDYKDTFYSETIVGDEISLPLTA